MGVTAARLAETQRAFDGVASVYDALNSRNPVIRHMRQRLWEAVAAHAGPGGRLLDVGCGPGPDAVHFARLGYRVVAIDSSADMVREAQHAVRRAQLTERVDVRQWSLEQLETLPDSGFDAIYSDLGPFNCVPTLNAVAAALEARLRPGGVFVASVIGRVCPWEWLRFAAPKTWSRIGVRFRRGLVPVPLNDRTVWTRYYRPSEFEQPFLAAGLQRLHLEGMGVVLPPPYLEGLATRHPRVIASLGAIDRWVGAWPAIRHIGDHFLIVLRRSES